MNRLFAEHQMANIIPLSKGMSCINFGCRLGPRLQIPLRSIGWRHNCLGMKNRINTIGISTSPMKVRARWLPLESASRDARTRIRAYVARTHAHTRVRARMYEFTPIKYSHRRSARGVVGTVSFDIKCRAHFYGARRRSSSSGIPL